MATINVFDAKAQFSKLIARAERGEEIVISRHGRAVARLVPMPTAQPDREAGWIEPFDVPEDFDQWTEMDEQDWFNDEPEHNRRGS
jgi:prevent-host-death family protein